MHGVELVITGNNKKASRSERGMKGDLLWDENDVE